MAPIRLHRTRRFADVESKKKHKICINLCGAVPTPYFIITNAAVNHWRGHKQMFWGDEEQTNIFFCLIFLNDFFQLNMFLYCLGTDRLILFFVDVSSGDVKGGTLLLLQVGDLISFRK